MKKYILLCLMVIGLSGCAFAQGGSSKNDVSFTGENERWDINVTFKEEGDKISTKTIISPKEDNTSIKDNNRYIISIYPTSADELPITDSDKERNEIVYESGTRYDELPSKNVSLSIEIGETNDTIKLQQDK